MKPTSTLPVTDVEGSPTLSITSARGTAVAYSWGPDRMLLEQVSSGQIKSGQVRSGIVRPDQVGSTPVGSVMSNYVDWFGLIKIV